MAFYFVALLSLAAVACSGDDQTDQAQIPPSTIRSSGALAYVDSDDSSPFAPRAGTADQNNPVSDGIGDGPIPSTVPPNPDFADPDEFGSGLDPIDSDPAGTETPTDTENLGDTENPDDPGNLGDTENPNDPGSGELPVQRPDGIELVFADGALASIAPRSTIEDIGRSLGPLYIITEEPFIRDGFDGGYSVSQGGEVLFWAVEENGRITTIMATNPRVGLDSGLRPTMPLIDAVALHGEPLLRLGPELREFAVFEDGTGTAEGVSVLVAIGQFDGPVGSYTGALAPGQETVGYQLANANIKELWFDLS